MIFTPPNWAGSADHANRHNSGRKIGQADRCPKNLANFCQTRYSHGMSTMNISLPEALKSFVDLQVSSRGYGTSSEYVRELIRKDQDLQELRGLLLEGAASPSAAPADGAWFEGLRDRVRRPAAS